MLRCRVLVGACVFLIVVFAVSCIIGVGGILCLLFVGTLGLMVDVNVDRRLARGRRDRGLYRCGDGVGLRVLRGLFACSMHVAVLVMIVVVPMLIMLVMIVMVLVIVRLRLVLLMAVLGMAMLIVVMMQILMAGVGVMLVALVGLGGLRRIEARTPDHLALDTLAMAAAARVTMARTTAVAVGAVLALFLGLAMRAFVGLDQRLTVRDRDLVVVGMDFAEGQEAMAVAAIFDEGCLQRRLYARNLGEVDIAAQLFALGSLEIKFFDAIAADHDDPGLFRVGGIDQHLVGHFGALDGGGRVAWRAQIAPPGDATVHLIRG
jgi:hypothetical protein